MPTRKQALLGCLVSAIAYAIAGVLLVVTLKHISDTNVRRSKQKRATDAVTKVKRGDRDVSIYQVETFVMLADDAECKDRVTSIAFWSCDLSDHRFHRVKELANVKNMHFYACQDVNKVLAAAADLESLEALSFDTIRASDVSPDLLANLSGLSKLHFDSVSGETIAELHERLPNVTIERQYPAIR